MLSNHKHEHFGFDRLYVNTILQVADAFPNLEIVFNEAPDSSALYRQGNITICAPLLPEGFGLVPLESLVYRRPVLVCLWAA